MKKIFMLLSSVLALFLGGCGHEQVSEPLTYQYDEMEITEVVSFDPESDTMDTQLLLSLLEADGFNFSELETSLRGVRLFPDANLTKLDISGIEIYEFATKEEVLWHARGIGINGSHFSYPALESGVEMRVWATFYWFKQDLIIVRIDYGFRPNYQLLYFLTNVLGESFSNPTIRIFFDIEE